MILLGQGDSLEKKTRGRGRKRTSQSKTKSQPKSILYYELIGIGIFVSGLLALAGYFGFNAGFVGGYFAKFLDYLFGIGSIVAIGVILFIGFHYIVRHHGIVYSKRFWGIIALYFSFLAIYHHFVTPAGVEIIPSSLPKGGGLIGGCLLLFLRKFFGEDGAIIVLIAGAVGAILLSTTWSLATGYFKTKEKAVRGAKAAGSAIAVTYDRVKEAHEARENETDYDGYTYNEGDEYIGVDQVQNEIPHNVEPPAQDRLKGLSETILPPRMSSKTLQDTIDLDLSSIQKESEETANAPVSDEAFEFAYNEQPEPVDEYPKYKEDYGAENSQESAIGNSNQGFTIEYGHQEAASFSADSMTEDVRQSDFEEMPEQSSESVPGPVAENAPKTGNEVNTQGKNGTQAQSEQKPYELPKVINILSKRVKKKNAALEIEIQENAHTLQKTLEDFKVKAKIINACHGPAVTRYELEPAPGVKVSKITNLSDDLALSLAAFSVRIEPIPGKAAIGIEVPNKELEGVQLREVLEDPAFEEAKSKLTVGLGKDIGGQAIFADLAKMPHLLVAGATGSGKSVCINTLITSILFKAKPDEVKFVLIDPKMVELSGYNGIPHLMVPVVTDAKRAASVLNWAVQEMEKRYAKFAEKVVRNMETYNEHFPDDKMASIVIIIDELADLMMVAPHDVEDAICRLAQKARAAGIHLVLATQRPSVDVITGIIKANIPSRISFAVSSQIDSRTILDMSGAEKLLGKGDMLFYPIGAAKPRRVQGAFVSDQEVEFLLDFIRGQGQEVEPDEEIINFTEQAMMEAEAAEKGKGKGKKQVPPLDDLLEEAVELVMSTGVASSSGIQRRFRVGYTRAARLLDTMTDLRIVGPSQGSKPRDILVNFETALEIIRNARASE
ncbi:MAG: DNA translocase FtsK [Selenomonadaceae bacterium]|nr:DNA translocase FtsK [Selenomonadaceae bacterium]